MYLDGVSTIFIKVSVTLSKSFYYGCRLQLRDFKTISCKHLRFFRSYITSLYIGKGSKISLRLRLPLESG